MRYPRRTVLKLMSAGAVTAFSGKVSFAQAGVVTRRTLTNMSLDDPDISTYRDFVGSMQAGKFAAPVNWLQFSLQHGDFDTGQYKFCPHGDWYFLPWHRAYTLMYEKAAQVLMGNNSFAMPYWNWTEMRDYPEAFANPEYKGMPNPLYIANRNPLTGSHALTDSIVGQQLFDDKIYKETIFEAFATSRNSNQDSTDPGWVPAGGGFQSDLENKPHNKVHNNIGVYMPTPGSPRDPLFFMHHSNIDRIWAYWNALGRKNSTDTLWLSMSFQNNYIRPTGEFYSATVQDLQSITDLGYTYDFLPQPDGLTPDTVKDNRLLALLHSQPGAHVDGVERLGGANTLAATALVPLVQKMPMTDATIKSVATPPEPGARRSEVYALIRNITMGDNVESIRVFVNHPNLTTHVPNTDPHYVTTVTFLDHKGGHAAPAGGHNAAAAQQKQLPSAIVNLTATLQRLYGFRRLKAGELTVQLIPVPSSGIALERVGKVVPASVEIAIL